MLHIECNGSPYEIGYKHGKEAHTQVHRTISFYTTMFLENTKKTWPEVKQIASEFEPVILSKWPSYHEEMQGLAAGAATDLLSIIAINVRTEINFGLFSDGCTALSWLTPDASFLAQNWDWKTQQKENLVLLTISPPNKPRIKMITEAGLIGKIGLNERGVGVCLNALQAKGIDAERIPCHLGLRLVLECNTKQEAVKKLEGHGVASACHMLIADGKDGGVGVEWSHKSCHKLEPNAKGQVFHSNHYLDPEMDVVGNRFVNDSGFRVKRIEHLCQEIEKPTMDNIREVFKDEENFPGAICRTQDDKKTNSATLFNIVMELKTTTAEVILGKPVAPEEEFDISF